MADRNKGFWFGTEQHASWFKTPLQGADSSPQAWGANGTLLNGGGWAVNSFGSHKRYSYEWGQSSSAETAQKMKSYYDGSYGRGLLHFVSCDIFYTNVLPAHWAAPSLALDYEAPSHVYGVEPKGVVTANAGVLDLPVRSVEYNLAGTPTAPTVGSTVFIPVPDGMTLYLGAFYSATQPNAGVFVQPVDKSGNNGALVRLTPLDNTSESVVEDTFSNLSGVRLWVGQTAGGGRVTISGMVGRLIETSRDVQHGPWQTQATNLFPDPSLETSGGTIEVKRNTFPNPRATTMTSLLRANGSGGAATDSTVTGPTLAGTNTFRRMVSTTAPTGADFGWIISRTNVGLPAGTPIPVSFALRSNVAMTTDLATSMYTGTTPGRLVNMGPVSLEANVWKRISLTIPLTGAENGYYIRTYRNTSGILAGDTLDISEIMETAAGDYFDGSLQAVPDVDFTPSWAGAVNTSESILSGVAVPVVSGVGCVPVRSQKWHNSGDYSLRLVATGASNISYASVVIPTGAVRTQGTALVTHRQESALSGSLWSARGRPYVNSPNQPSPTQSPNASGTTDHRIFFSSLTADFRLYLPHGGTRGSGDVWYDSLGIFEGTYVGPWFDGSTAPVDDPDTHRYRWTGTPNTSTSVYETRTRSGSPSAVAKIKRGPWIGGQGNSGCRFAQPPSYVTNGPNNGGQVGFSATFVEVGSNVYG